MTILAMIQDALETITADDIERSAAFLGEPTEDEKVLRVIRSEHARRLWALAHIYSREDRLCAHAYLYDARDAAERSRLAERGVRYNRLESVARDLAWCEIREEANAWNVEVGMREGFTLVQCPPEAKSTSGVGVISLTPAMARMFEKVLAGINTGEAEADDAPPKPRRKPQ